MLNVELGVSQRPQVTELRPMGKEGAGEAGPREQRRLREVGDRPGEPAATCALETFACCCYRLRSVVSGSVAACLLPPQLQRLSLRQTRPTATPLSPFPGSSQIGGRGGCRLVSQWLGGRGAWGLSGAWLALVLHGRACAWAR